MIVYQCEDSLESIFTAIYNAYEERRDHADTRISLTDELLLFAEYIPASANANTSSSMSVAVILILSREKYFDIIIAMVYGSSPVEQAALQIVILSP